jgi:3-oxoadipate enol-lactonase
MPIAHARDGTALHYAVHSEGAMGLLLLHAMGSSDVWRPLLKKLPLTEFTVVTCDLRGHGQSGGAPGDFTFPRLHEDLVTIMSELRELQWIVVGFSGSCKNAAWLAAFAPTKVAGLVLVAPCGFGVVPLPRQVMAYFTDYLSTKKTIPPEFEAWFTPRIAEEKAAVIRSLVEVPKPILDASAELWVFTDMTDVAKRVLQPAVVVIAREDPVYGMLFQQETTLAVLPHASRVQVEGGHFIPYENAAALADVIQSFVRRLAASPA